MSDVGDRQHAATPTRRQQARRDGDVAKSLELATAIQMLGMLVVASLTLGQIGTWLKAWTSRTWNEAGTKLSVETSEVTEQLQTTLSSSLSVLLPLMLLMFLVAVASHWLQTGPMFNTGRISPEFSRIGLANWKQRTFSFAGLTQLIIGLPKTIIAAAVFGLGIYHLRFEFYALSNFPIDVMAQQLLQLIIKLTAFVAVSLLVTSLADLWIKHADHQRRIRMTDQELRDELRSQNGNSQVRERQRNLNRVG
jgi:flagellar biosynthetic protein FlhB